MLLAIFFKRVYLHFNPRLREGGDKRPLPGRYGRIKFQSTPPRRRRLILTLRFASHYNFNPRLREGGDQPSAGGGKCGNRFQSTPPRRRRRFSPWLCLSRSVFQSTPPRRRRLASRISDWGHDSISIHASAKEATHINDMYQYQQ